MIAFLGNGVSLMDEIIGLRFDIATTTFSHEKMWLVLRIVDP